MPSEESLGDRTADSRSQNQNYSSDILERVTDPIVALDKNWRYTYLNAEADRLFGFHPKDTIGKDIRKEFPEGAKAFCPAY